MIKFEAPEIRVVYFNTADISTELTSGGYEQFKTGSYAPWSNNTVVGGSDGDMSL